jgi:hypothetical protein
VVYVAVAVVILACGAVRCGAVQASKCMHLISGECAVLPSCCPTATHTPVSVIAQNRHFGVLI